MKTVILFTALSLVGSALANDFQPSHALAAKLRFQAINNGEAFEDWTPRGETKEQTIERIKAKSVARRDALLGQLEAEIDAHNAKPEVDTNALMDRIKALESKLEEANATKPEASTAKPEANTTVEEASVTPTISTDNDDTNLLAVAGIGAGTLAAAGACMIPFWRRRKALDETDQVVETDNWS